MRKMADLLGLSYRSLRYLMDKYQIKPSSGSRRATKVMGTGL
jgi:hypothetical protein